jgi:hypothetical protein
MDDLRDCKYFGTDGEPCWGNIIPVDEIYIDEPDYSDHWWVYTCWGHEERYDGGLYVPEPKDV